EVRAVRRAVSGDLYRTARHGVADEVANGVGGVQRQHRAHERKQAADHRVEAARLRPGAAEKLRDALALPVSRARVGRERRSRIILGNVRECWRLLTVDRARTGKQQAARAVRTRQFQHPARARQIQVQGGGRMLRIWREIAFRGRVHHQRERSAGIRKRGAVARPQGHRGVARQMRRTLAERFRMARQQHRRNPQRQAAVGPQQALRQPRADKPGAAGQEKALAPRRRPQLLGMGQDMVQIARQWILHGPFQIAACAAWGIAWKLSNTYSSMAGVMPGYTPTQNTRSITKSVLVSGPAMRYATFW